MPGTMLIFGLGYTGERFARELLAEGWTVWGTVRRQASFDQCTAMGLSCLLLPSDPQMQTRDQVEDAKEVMQTVTHILVTAAPTADGDPMIARFSEALRDAPELQWVGYLSNIAVYGNGQEVDETSPVKPNSARARRRVLAETQWLQTGLPVHIFRLPGIYGPGRGPLAAARAGTAKRVIKEGHVFSRIHVDDIVNVLRASIARPRPGAIYNVVDDLQAPGHAVTAYACKLLRISMPPLVRFDDAQLSPEAMSFYESRIMSNRLIKEELGVKLRYPTYREGLKAQLQEEVRRGLAPAPRQSLLRTVLTLPLRPFNWARKGLRELLPSAALSMDDGDEEEDGPRPRSTDPVVLLVDHGSSRAAAALNLRAVAAQLEDLLDADPTRPIRTVISTSIRLSDRVPPEELGGNAVPLAVPLIESLIAQGERRLVIVPFFLGPSPAIHEVLTKALQEQVELHPDLDARIAPPLVCRCPFLFGAQTEDYGDNVIAEILHDRIVETIRREKIDRHPAVVLVEHGSRQPAVGRVTEYVAASLLAQLHDKASVFFQSSLEQPGDQTLNANPAFLHTIGNPLLEQALEWDQLVGKDVVVALMFLGPGHHAGPGGDVARIIEKSTAGRTGRVYMTDIVGSHPKLVSLLAKRFTQAVPLDAVPRIP